ncbi:hypothetical protein CSUI_006956 [Cystoisospora suis]|uniref:Transmembrane protein n=1 Tax=Cystoisospora suis TaxID=483139 RepID=A0A2C6KSB4_9APIC|nr:hypothetical protein CSUI_006956 [Cystoisospora suis]
MQNLPSPPQCGPSRLAFKFYAWIVVLCTFALVSLGGVSGALKEQGGVKMAAEVAVEEVQRTEDEEAATDDKTITDDAVTNPDSMAQALTQRLQELYTDTFRFVAESKAESESFKEGLHQYMDNLKSGLSAADPAQFRLLGGMSLSWLEGEKSRKDARTTLDKLGLVLGQLEGLTQEVGAVVASGVKQVIDQGRLVVASLVSSLEREEKQGVEDEQIQKKIQASALSAAESSAPAVQEEV